MRLLRTLKSPWFWQGWRDGLAGMLPANAFMFSGRGRSALRKMLDRHELAERLHQVRRVEVTPEMLRQQAESFARAMTARCEHGELDFEQCPKCRGWDTEAR